MGADRRLLCLPLHLQVLLTSTYLPAATPHPCMHAHQRGARAAARAPNTCHQQQRGVEREKRDLWSEGVHGLLLLTEPFTLGIRATAPNLVTAQHAITPAAASHQDPARRKDSTHTHTHTHTHILYIHTYIHTLTLRARAGRRVSRPRGTGSVGDSVGEGAARAPLLKAGVENAGQAEQGAGRAGGCHGRVLVCLHAAAKQLDASRCRCPFQGLVPVSFRPLSPCTISSRHLLPSPASSRQHAVLACFGGVLWCLTASLSAVAAAR